MSGDCKIESAIRARCIKRSRKYTFKDLNELRHLESYRAMPTNILCSVEILSQGLGLKAVITNSFTIRKEVRLRQIQIAKNLEGYQNYISLIPNKNERKYNIHPTTPTTPEILALSKKKFDRKIRNWKRGIHCWDAIYSHAEIPYHLLTDRMLNERNMTSLTATNNNKSHSQYQYIWSPKQSTNKDYKSPKKSFKYSKSEKRISTHPTCRKKLQFDDDQKENDAYGNTPIGTITARAVYSSTKHKWYKPKNGLISNDISSVKITRDEAIECLKICISNVRSRSKIDAINQDNNFNDMLVNEFNKLLSEI